MKIFVVLFMPDPYEAKSPGVPQYVNVDFAAKTLDQAARLAERMAERIPNIVAKWWSGLILTVEQSGGRIFEFEIQETDLY